MNYTAREKKFIPARDLPCLLLLLAGMVALGISLSTLEHLVLLAPFFGATVLQPWLSRKFDLKPDTMTYLVLSLPFGLAAQAWEATGRGFGLVGIEFNLLFYGSLYLLLMALIKLYSKPDPQRLPRVLLAATACMVAAGGDAADDRLYIVLVAFYALPMLLLLRNALHVRSPDPQRRITHRRGVFIAFIASLILTWVLVAGVRYFYYDISRIFFRLAVEFDLSPAPGFSGQAKLGNISELRNSAVADAIALRAFSRNRVPGYLRGKVFFKYGGGQWLAFEGTEDLQPLPDSAHARLRELFVLPGREPPTAAEEAQLLIYPIDSFSAHYFLPLNTVAVESGAEAAKLEAGGIMRSHQWPTSKGYDAFTDITAPVRAGAAEGSVLALPNGERLQQVLANTVARLGLGPQPEAAELTAKVRAIENFFANNYTYHYGIKFSGRNDPLVEFLTEKTHGHCELFASAGTLLLRYLKVPARYVTGFYCAEKNEYGDYYVARNKHAHAWVEYYDELGGWQVAEFTPARAQPQIEPHPDQQLREYLMGWWARIKGLGVGGILRLMLDFIGRGGQWLLGAWWRILILALVIGGYFFLRWWRNRRERLRYARPPRVFPAHIATARERFMALEKELSRNGLGRNEGETIAEYAARLRNADIEERDEIVAFVENFSALRYGHFECP